MSDMPQQPQLPPDSPAPPSEVPPTPQEVPLPGGPDRSPTPPQA